MESRPSNIATESKRRSVMGKPITVGVFSLVVGFVMMAKVLGGVGGDITIFLAFGEDAVAITDHAEDVLDRSVFLRNAQGHDGKFFFLQSLDPLYLEPERHSILLDRPIYRGQRMLYPLIAGGFGAMPTSAIPWAMVFVNILAMGIGGWGTARLALRLGTNVWWGLAFPFNIGLLSEFAISGAGIVAFAAAVWAFAALEKREYTAASLLLIVSVLAREAMLLSAFGAFIVARRRTGEWKWPLIVWPGTSVAIWAVYLRLRLEGGAGVDEVQEIGPPFGGIFNAFSQWLDRPLDLIVGLLLLAIIVLFVLRTLRSDSYMAWGTVGFALLAVLLTRQVWLRHFDITRAIAPLLTAFVIVTFATPKSESLE